MTRSTIVVGVDGSAGADHALAWARARAEATDAEVRAVLTWDLPVSLVTAPGIGASPVETLERAARASLDAVLDRAGAAGGPDTATIRQGPPHHQLLAEAEETGAEMVVVGTRGLGPIRRVLLGSVSSRIARDATMPVAVVPLGAPIGTSGPAIVGVDGSPGAVAALRWARAALDVPLHAVHVVAPPFGPEYGLTGWLGGEQEAFGRQIAERTVTEALGADADVEVEVRIGDARDVLTQVAATERASVLVVGSRGGQGLGGLGSVSTSVASAADVATIVVPPP